ncbi:MBL fold metallo-hydrolase [Clostridium cibarium]|uniref:MBL fold metallo-hydrolase n=1 Tax=Clostridium cibarium TaxID=2762247 RepID=A0ABR8PTS5_9CLOT|nr:MBL fold metallo-hydrolase [Clostridium cibarium]MBD7911580.1 MBL fold metallo-hydrolase [Clostridium cibarium]
MSIKITTLIENQQDNNDTLVNEHGLALFIEFEDKKILFDTGQSGDFIKNAEKLNKDINNLDYVILSHGHYDHSGGFREFTKYSKKNFKLIVGNGFFNEKYKLIEEGYKFNGNSFSEEFIVKNNIAVKYVTEDIFKITDELMVFTNFERSTEFETLNEKFFIKKNEGYILDDFSDEISLGVKYEKGLVVILGCSHIGIVNILKTIMKRTGMPIYCVVGGSHLIEADELRLNKTMEFFKENSISLLRLSHCTGENAIYKLKHEFRKEFIYNNTGNSIEII